MKDLEDAGILCNLNLADMFYSIESLNTPVGEDEDLEQIDYVPDDVLNGQTSLDEIDIFINYESTRRRLDLQCPTEIEVIKHQFQDRLSLKEACLRLHGDLKRYATIQKSIRRKISRIQREISHL